MIARFGYYALVLVELTLFLFGVAGAYRAYLEWGVIGAFSVVVVAGLAVAGLRRMRMRLRRRN
jgi:hypothetical protein